MVYAITDDVLAPKGVITIEYYGKNPFSIYPRISRNLQVIFHARGKDIFEDEFRWDVTADPNPFFIKVHLDKGLDKWTTMYIRLKIFGTQPTNPNKDGKMVLEISGDLITRYPTGTAWQKAIVTPFVWLYHHLIYNNIRRRYLKIGLEGIEKLETEFRSILGLVMRERLA